MRFEIGSLVSSRKNTNHFIVLFLSCVQENLILKIKILLIDILTTKTIMFMFIYLILFLLSNILASI